MFNQKLYFVIAFGIFSFVSNTVGQFQCFKCSSKVDELCTTSPEDISSGDVTVNCKEEAYCTIIRTEFTDVPGQVISFVRDCEEKPLIQNDIRTDAHYTKYYRSCKGNKCNGGDGLIGSGGNSNVPSEILLVPEKSRSKSLHASSSSSIWISILSTLTFLYVRFNH